MSGTSGKVGLIVMVLVILLGGLPSFAGRFEDDVRARWRGAWVIVDVESYSACSGAYTTNKVSGEFVTDRGGRRFEPGEPGKVDRVQIRRKSAELMVRLDVPVLWPLPDGPFTLYEERSCAVELKVLIPRDVIKAKDAAEVDRILQTVAERYPTREDVYGSSDWNGREQESWPEDYELTVARHAQWRAEQANLAVDEKLHLAREHASGSAGRIDDDPHYLQGLAAGTRAMEGWTARGCGQLVGGTFASAMRAVPEEHRGDDAIAREWREGYKDGQLLVYSLTLLEDLGGCYVPVPEVPQSLIDRYDPGAAR